MMPEFQANTWNLEVDYIVLTATAVTIKAGNVAESDGHRLGSEQLLDKAGKA